MVNAADLKSAAAKAACGFEPHSRHGLDATFAAREVDAYLPAMPAVTLTPAAQDDRATLENLVQLYCYDWSEIINHPVGDDGRFGDLPLASYWVDDWRHPFLLRVEGRLAGFALIGERSRLTGARGVFDMAEFFVMRNYRRQGVGSAAAFAAFDLFKGPWEVRQRDENADATTFWRRVIGEYTRRNYEEVRWDDAEWTGLVQRFTTA
jgi:predicted acetyltransferase